MISIRGKQTDIFHAAISASSSGNNELIAAVSGKRILVHSFFFITAGAVNVQFQSGAGGDPLTGVLNFAANTGVSCSHNEGGWFETNGGENLNMNLTGAVLVAGSISYSYAKDE